MEPSQMPDLELNPAKTALVVIDLQVAIKGMGRNLAPHSLEDVCSRTAAVAEALRAKGGIAAYIRVDPADMLQRLTDVPSRGLSEYPPDATTILPESGYRKGIDLVTTKRSWGAFHNTDLNAKLREKSIDTILITGIATNMGVESTARSAADIGYNVVFLEDAMSSLSAEMHAFPFQLLFPRLGRVRSTAQVLEALA